MSYGAPRASTVRIVDPETRMENPAGTVGEIWVQGDNVGLGYWRNPQQTEATFRARLVTPSPGTSEGPWLRTGDLGVIFEGELFITGRIKELLVVDGANHYPEDIEATIQEITGGRVVAIAVPDDRTEKLVTIIELMKRGRTDEEERIDSAPSNVKSPPRYPGHIVCASRMSLWWRRVLFRSPPAVRFGVRPALSVTYITNSAA